MKKTLVTGLVILACCLFVYNAQLRDRVFWLEQHRVIIYQVDNAGAEMHGKITNKQIIHGRYTVTAGSYGKFLVTKEQYDEIKVGDEIPDYLKQRGN